MHFLISLSASQSLHYDFSPVNTSNATYIKSEYMHLRSFFNSYIMVFVQRAGETLLKNTYEN